MYNKLKLYILTNYPVMGGILNKYKSIVKFVISGTFATAVDLSLLFILHELFNIRIVVSAASAFAIAIFVSFNLQKFWTFRNRVRTQMYRQLIPYFITGISNVAINAYTMHILVEEYNIRYLLAQIIIGGILGIVNFLVLRFLIFHKKHETKTQ